MKDLTQNLSEESPIAYWLCCGSTDPAHRDETAKDCIEAKIGHPYRCIYGTLKELGKMSATNTKDLTANTRQRTLKNF